MCLDSQKALVQCNKPLHFRATISMRCQQNVDLIDVSQALIGWAGLRCQPHCGHDYMCTAPKRSEQVQQGLCRFTRLMQGSGPAHADRPKLQGLYMWGGVGVGKTMLMDLLAHSAPKSFQVSPWSRLPAESLTPWASGLADAKRKRGALVMHDKRCIPLMASICLHHGFTCIRLPLHFRQLLNPVYDGSISLSMSHATGSTCAACVS